MWQFCDQHVWSTGWEKTFHKSPHRESDGHNPSQGKRDQGKGDHPDGAFWTTLSCPTAQFYPTSRPSRGSIVHHWPWLQRARSLAAFNVTLLILVLEIPFNFQFDMQCAGNASSNVSFQVNASFEQILFQWHTWERSKGLRTIGS